jgi:hypothetical protein
MENKETPSRKLGQLLSEIIWEHVPHGVRATSNFITREARGVKHGWALFAVIFIAGLITAGFVVHKIDSIPASDLRVSIVSYFYDCKTDELHSSVQFVNNGKTPRTVMGVKMFYRSNSDAGFYFLTDSGRPDFFLDDSPIYVEPRHPKIVSYSYKPPEGLFTIPGEVFGLYFTTLNEDGSMHFSAIEALTVADAGYMRASYTKNISLDAGNFIAMPPSHGVILPNSKHDR